MTGGMETPRWPSVARTGRTIRAVARLAKLSGFGTVAAVGAHHARTRPTPNADPALLARNEWLVRPEGGLVDAVRTRIERAEMLRREAAEAEGRTPPRKRRSDAVLAVEVVLSASPEFFRPERPWEAGAYDPERLAAWRDASLAWLKGRYGDNLVSAVLHLDEATPHIQAVFVPLTADHRLSAKLVVGGPDDLRRFQDSVGEAVAPLGIQRGMEGSIAVHRDVDEYYALVNRPREPTPVQVAVGTPPLVGRERWAAEETGRIKARVEPALHEAEAKADAAELAHEQVRKLPAIVAGVRADAAASIREAEARAEARVEAAERDADAARHEAAEAGRAADMALERARSAAEALRDERRARGSVRQMSVGTVLEAAGTMDAGGGPPGCTPGQWRAGHSSDGREGVYGGDGSLVCGVYGGILNDPDRIAADAGLIAAAPVMFAALHSVYEIARKAALAEEPGAKEAFLILTEAMNKARKRLRKQPWIAAS